MKRIVLFALAALAAWTVPPADAQTDVLYEFDLSTPQTTFRMEAGDQVKVAITFADHSKDTTETVAPGTGVFVNKHTTSFSIQYLTEDLTGFQAVKPLGGPIISAGGEVYEREMSVTTTIQVRQEVYRFRLVAETQTPNGTFVNTLDFAVITPGPPTFNAQGTFSETLPPGTVASFPIAITNHALVPRSFIVQQSGNDCGMSTAFERTILVQPKSTDEVRVDFRTPSGKPLYLSQLCGMTFLVAPEDVPSQTKTIIVSPQIEGVYTNPLWTFWLLATAAAIVLFVFLVNRRKQIIEEEILGKPQKPWTIPVERVYLEHLEAKDPRAAYVVRHFLMEEEYASALLWYKHYKQATRGERSKEALVVRQEKKYDRFQRKWEQRIAVPLQQADRFDARLQRKLDRFAKREVRKDRRKWKKTVATLEQAVEAQNAKALAKWEKAAAKAEKKGLAPPPRPELETPDLPPEPQLQKIALADHKWNKKAQRFRRKMIKRQGNLEVKFERKDARMLHKLRKKVHKIARKLDDPQFVEEHPLLASEPSGPTGSS